MIGFEPVDDRAERRFRPAQDREEQRIFQAMVVVDEPAIGEAVHPQFPERPLGLEIANGRAHLAGGGTGFHPRRQALHGRQVAADHGVDPEQLAEESLGRCCGRRRLGSRHCLILLVGRRIVPVAYLR
jgi:hypothetical protein